ncbi:Mannitol 2-dehydrogenase [uncultured Pleomorphomonas sp.]|uniref:Mannitol 2-dehydrogenase n=1 Tax=uncultured Pleomorphomonas sp. TaxID=442121 RepID=A0A212LID4_9HYPH|nr:mannitol dehydrogenase family protein [uncultured Pleomorphomonas sp.]SCM77298.1 Mannitol 2-dehydrogenase [uncultured Pleomorphomonas sp.]
MPIALSLAALDNLPQTVTRPAYRRADLKPGIVHFGLGNFHRAHQEVYLDLLMSAGKAHDWAIIGAGVRDSDTAMRKALEPQDYLTTLVELGGDPAAARVIGPVVDIIPVEDRERLVETLASPEIRIVSMTITEGGYYLDSATGRFDAAHPEIVADGRNPDDPRTVFGLILKGLRRRRDRGVPPFTVMSCDNIPGNGEVTHQTLTGLAGLSDPAFAAWVGASVAMPNAMVDRITPATTDRECQKLRDEFGIVDNWPVFCEPFRQWVVEDHFPLGRPPFEDVGVTFVPDVAPYEMMKIRILNGGHATIAYPAALMGIHGVHEAMANPLIARFLETVERTEIIPIVPPVPDTDLVAYYELVADRFANPKVGDTIARLCLDGSNRQPKFIIPSSRDRLRQGLDVTGLSLVSALWCRYCAGTDDAGNPIPPNDDSWERLRGLALRAKDDPLVFLDGLHDIFGDVGESPRFRQLFAAHLEALWARGSAAVLTGYLAAA